jgi:glycerol uptake facilitator-like aquaporin
VKLAVLVRRRIDVREAVGYWISQLIGALAGIAVVSAVAPTQTSPMTLSGHAVIAPFVAELLVTFAWPPASHSEWSTRPTSNPIIHRGSFRSRRRCDDCDG